MVDFVGMDAVDEIDQPAAGREIAVMQEHANVGKVRVHINMVYAAGVERAGTTNDSVHLIAFGQKQFSKIGTVLPGDSRDQSTFQRTPHLPEGLEHLRRTAQFRFFDPRRSSRAQLSEYS